MEGGIDGGQDAAFCAEADIPSFFVKVEVFGVEFLEEVRVADVQLVGGYADDWAW